MDEIGSCVHDPVQGPSPEVLCVLAVHVMDIHPQQIGKHVGASGMDFHNTGS